jgi:aspartate aminotransferase-like enzyme
MIRIGTLGAISESDVLTDLVHLADVLGEMGHRCSAADAVAAALAAGRD